MKMVMLDIFDYHQGELCNFIQIVEQSYFNILAELQQVYTQYEYLQLKQTSITIKIQTKRNHNSSPVPHLQMASIIQNLQSTLQKSKQKSPNIQHLLSLINTLTNTSSVNNNNDGHQNVHLILTLNQKGIVLELLAKVCYHQWEIFSKVIREFYSALIIDKDKTTTRKRANYGDRQRGNTTTVKKRKTANPQAARNSINLAQMLQIELSSPNNTQPRSQQQTLQKQRHLQEVLAVEPLSISPIIGLGIQKDQFATPLKAILEQENNQDKILDQYRAIIDMKSDKKQRTRTKNKEANTRTRKKTQRTQALQQQINTNISLSFPSQISLHKQIQNILESTKKKKHQQKQKQNYYTHEIFQPRSQEIQFTFTNRQNMALFCLENNDKFSKKKQHSEQNNHYSQRSNFMFSFDQEDVNDQNYQVGEQRVQFDKKEQFDRKLSNQFRERNQIDFGNFLKKNSFNIEQKAVFFYDLLCQTEKYTMRQDNIENFGEIHIRINLK